MYLLYKILILYIVYITTILCIKIYTAEEFAEAELTYSLWVPGTVPWNQSCDNAECELKNNCTTRYVYMNQGISKMIDRNIV